MSDPTIPEGNQPERATRFSQRGEAKVWSSAFSNSPTNNEQVFDDNGVLATSLLFDFWFQLCRLDGRRAAGVRSCAKRSKMVCRARLSPEPKANGGAASNSLRVQPRDQCQGTRWPYFLWAPLPRETLKKSEAAPPFALGSGESRLYTLEREPAYIAAPKSLDHAFWFRLRRVRRPGVARAPRAVVEQNPFGRSSSWPPKGGTPYLPLFVART
jgi:hypothetical protein